jgi:hypothetical protein
LVDPRRFWVKARTKSQSSGVGLFRARAAAAGRVAEADVTAAAGVAAGFEACAAGLEHVAALGVAAGAGDTATVLRVFALTVAAAQRQIADLDAVPGAAARAHAIAQSLTKILQRGGRLRIVTIAVNAETTLALFEPQLAARNDADVGRRGGRASARLIRPRRRPGGEGSARTFGQNSAGHRTLLWSKSWPRDWST